MKKTPFDRFFRIPVRYVDDRWECEYRGIVPVAANTEADLIVKKKSITDKEFLDRMNAKSSIKVLDEGASLLVYLATKEATSLTAEQMEYLIPWRDGPHEIAGEHIDNWNTGGLKLIEVSIGKPNVKQSRKFGTEKGGLWLLTEGPKAAGLQSTQINLPTKVFEDPVHSLNHAFTKLSETYEPWRISHTGNVYQRFLYKEADGKWYPLEFLRNAALAQKGQEIAYQLWQDFLKRMSANSTGKKG
jgi:hypothetical protein